MTPVPDHIAARRSAQRSVRRRRRLIAALLVAAGVVAVAAIVLAARKGSENTASRAAAPGAGVPRHAGSGAPAPSRPAPGSATATTAAQAAAVTRLARLGLPVYCAGPRGHDLAFTFDDGPGPYTHFAIKKLRQARERATFFVVGRSITNFPGWLGREEAVATIADHTMTHPVLPALPPGEIEQQIARTRDMIVRATGQRVLLFRPPYGSRNATVDGIAKRLGLLEILWNVDSADSLGANYAGITQNVVAGLHPGSIILMHENRGQTIRALTAILPVLRARGLRSVPLPELLASDPPSLAQLQAGPRGCGGALLHGNGG